MTTGTIDAATEFSTEHNHAGGVYDLSVRGTFSGTIQLQRKRRGDADSAYRDDGDPITTPIEATGLTAGPFVYRFKRVSWTSGAATVEIGS